MSTCIFLATECPESTKLSIDVYKYYLDSPSLSIISIAHVNESQLEEFQIYNMGFREAIVFYVFTVASLSIKRPQEIICFRPLLNRWKPNQTKTAVAEVNNLI